MKPFTFIVALALPGGLLSASFAESGSEGERLSWAIDRDGVLIVWGGGGHCVF